MLDFLAQNYGSIIVAAALIAILALAAVKLLRDKRTGKGGCGGNCAECHGCAHSIKKTSCKRNKTKTDLPQAK